MIVQCATFSKSLNPRNIDKTVSDTRFHIRFPFESSFWISVSGCKLTILPDIQPANRIVIISGTQWIQQCCQLFLQRIYCTKSSLKIYQIWNIYQICLSQKHKFIAAFSLLINNFCLMINSCFWAMASWSCNLIFYFPALPVTDLLTTGKFNPPTSATAFSLLLWSTALLWCIISCLVGRGLQFFFFLHSLQKGYTALVENYFAILANSIRHSSLISKSSATLMCSFPIFGCIEWLKPYAQS